MNVRSIVDERRHLDDASSSGSNDVRSEGEPSIALLGDDEPHAEAAGVASLPL